MDIMVSTLCAAAIGASLSALYYIGKILISIIFKLLKYAFQSKTHRSYASSGTCAVYNAFFSIIVAVIYSIYLYVTVDGELRFMPLISGVLGFAFFTRCFVKPAKKLIAATYTKRKNAE